MANPFYLLNGLIYNDVSQGNSGVQLLGYSVPFATEQSYALPTLNTIFVDTNALSPQGRGVKTFYIQVLTQITQGSGQTTVQPYVGRSAMAAAGGATTQLDNTHTVVDTAANWGASGTTIPVGLYAFSPKIFSEMQWYHPFVGLEIKFVGGAISAGTFQVFIDSSSH